MITIVDRFAQGDYFHACAAAALFGALSHQVVRTIEFEFVMFHFMAASVFIYIAQIYTFDLVRATLLEISFHAGLFCSIAVYRLFFHRCRKFPGPFGAKLTRLYATRLSARNVQFFRELERLHAQYGDFVRTGEHVRPTKATSSAKQMTGPREISVLRKEAISLIYGPISECRKSTMYGQTGNDPKMCSINMTRDFNSHRLRRRAWDRGFSTKCRNYHACSQLSLTISSSQHIRASHQIESRHAQGSSMQELRKPFGRNGLVDVLQF